MGFLKRMSGWLLKPNSVPYNRLIKGHTVSSPTDFADKDYVDEAYELSNDNLTATIAAIMARMGFVMIPTNISLSPFPNPITVNGRNYMLVEKQRVLLIGQTTPSENGVYEVSGANLVRINDLVALDGISISTNQISLKRWANALNALRFNGSGEAQVRVRNTGTNAFGGLQVDTTTGEIWIDETTLPGFAGSLTIEQLLLYIGVASKMNFNDDFITDWDNTNNRISLSLAGMISRCFGSGADGDVVVSGTSTLTANLYCENLTVETTGIINTNGFGIFVKGTLTNYGVIRNNGVWNASTPAGYLGQGAATSATNSLGGANSAGANATAPTAANGGIQAAYLLPNTLFGGYGTTKYSGGGGVSAAGGGGGVVLIAARKIEGNGRVEARGAHGNSTETLPFASGAGGGGVIFVVSGNLLSKSGNHFRVDGGHGNTTAFGAFGRIISVQSTDKLLIENSPVIESVTGQLRRNGLSSIIVSGQNITYCTHFHLGINRNLYKINQYKRISENSVEVQFEIHSSAPLGNTTIVATNRVAETLKASSPFTVSIAEGAPLITSFSMPDVDMGYTGNITVNGSGFTPDTVVTQTSGSGLTINSTTYVNATTLTINVTAGTEHKLFNILATNSVGDSGISGNNGLYVVYPSVSLDVATVAVNSLTGYSRAGAVFTKDNDGVRRELEFTPKLVKNLRTGNFFGYEIRLRYGTHNGTNGDTTSTIKIYGYRNASDNANERRIRLYKDSSGNAKFVENPSLNPTTSSDLFLVFGFWFSNIFQASTSSSLIISQSITPASYDEVEFFVSCINDGDVVQILQMTGRFKV